MRTIGAFPDRREAGSELFLLVGGGLIVVGGLVAAVNSAAAFAHGSWLAAYLVLVGGVAQLTLGLGRLGLPVPAVGYRQLRLQLGGWNAGTLAVAAGVLAGSAALVMLGSAALLTALGSFALAARRGWSGARRRTLAYAAVVLTLTVSVAIGCVLGVSA